MAFAMCFLLGVQFFRIASPLRKACFSPVVIPFSSSPKCEEFKYVNTCYICSVKEKFSERDHLYVSLQMKKFEVHRD